MEFGDTGNLAKVTVISEERRRCRVFFDLRDGRTGSFELPRDTYPGHYTVGDILLIRDQDNYEPPEKVPTDAWPHNLWIGVVKIKLDDVTIIESSGRLRIVPTVATLHYEPGNTVQAGELLGVTRVLSKEPISTINLPSINDSVIKQFVTDSSDSHTLTFDDFGGLTTIVARARELIEIPLKHHTDLATIGARPIKGVLFTGEPGTGKTMLARIIAAQSEAQFYEISGPEVFSKWYGQSEELLRKLFTAAAKHDKAIIFFDEIDSVAGQRDDDVHEASKRVVAQLLALMDGFNADSNVVVIAATNRPQDLDIALRRPGRFDWEIEFPYPDEQDRRDILIKTARRLRTQGMLPHREIASKSEGWSGADLTAIWSEAALLAVSDQRDKIFREDYVGGFERVARQKVHRLGSIQLSQRNG